MQKLRNKWNSQTGASMMLALLFLLLCLTIGAVVLTAAYANTGRLQRTVTDQQTYYAVASAARLIESDVKSSSFSGAYDKLVTQHSSTEQTGTDEAGEPIYTVRRWTETTFRAQGTELWDGRLLPACLDDLWALYLNQVLSDTTIASAWTGERPALPYDMTYSLSFPEDKAHGFPAVMGSLSVVDQEYDGEGRSRYTLLVWLCAQDGSDPMTLCFSPMLQESVSVSEYGDTVITTYTTTITWEDPVITKGVFS